MLAFAANSLLCRAALLETDIDAASFTSLRLISGALMLACIVMSRQRFATIQILSKGNWQSACMLFVYAAGFSFAYVSISAATGAFYAILSGAIASGAGYALWYAVLPMLRATSAATLQLSVPVITAVAGVFLLNEPLTLRIVLSSLVILGGVALVIRLQPTER